MFWDILNKRVGLMYEMNRWVEILAFFHVEFSMK